MLVELFRAARRLDAAINHRLGPAYNVLLGVGLVAEIVRRLREIGEERHRGPILSALAIAMFALLLLHQLAELSEHIERRFRHSRPGR